MANSKETERRNMRGWWGEGASRDSKVLRKVTKKQDVESRITGEGKRERLAEGGGCRMRGWKG